MLTLVPGSMGGSETYARALTRTLPEDPHVHVEAFVPPSARGFSEAAQERVIDGIRIGRSTPQRLAGIARINMHAASIRRTMQEFDVVHFPFTLPMPKPPKSSAFVQSLLDVQHLELPALFSKGELMFRRRYYEGAARHVDALITISHFAKQRMVELAGLDADRVHVAQLGVDADRFVPNFGARGDFVLYPARPWPHKNHARLFEAMELARRARPSLRLVLTGGGLESLGTVPEWVDRRGLVSEQELGELYRTASALVFPSLYEGFGLPPLEAMASGCPVAASNAGSIPEVVGTAGVLFDPHDPADIARGIHEAIARTAELSHAGVAHARTFTWDRCRQAHVAAYRSALER
ncbi:glycosyltransferase family 4 protein [Rathayibacter soli]|uniref:glycosyltransferase family 4 protein n=1 Tax=Rathayibacter soli TaxID=3144168 RepID=UPI0027E5B32F|nr:glycosyltransferase family 1 protein [Glaciibacter superstes]